MRYLHYFIVVSWPVTFRTKSCWHSSYSWRLSLCAIIVEVFISVYSRRVLLRLPNHHDFDCLQTSDKVWKSASYRPISQALALSVALVNLTRAWKPYFMKFEISMPPFHHLSFDVAKIAPYSISICRISSIRTITWALGDRCRLTLTLSFPTPHVNQLATARHGVHFSKINFLG